MMTARQPKQLLLAIAVVVLVAPWSRADWPQWRGPHRAGVAHHSNLPTTWPTQTPTPVWRTEIGEGQSSPVIAHGRLFIMGREAGDIETCLCLDVKTGKQLWKHSYAAPVELHPAARSAGKGPKSTPTVDGDRVYMLGVNGMFHCFNAADGRILWKRDFNAEFWGKKGDDGYDAWATYCGASSAPLIDGDRIILPVGGPKAGAFTAFAKADGSVAWKANGGPSPDALPDRSSYASPIIVELAGVRQIIGFTGTRLVGLRTDDGRLLWDYPFRVSYDQTIITPVVWKDLVILGGESNPTTALRIEKKQDRFAAVVAWQNRDLQAYMTSPVVQGEHLFGIDEGGQLICLDLTKGQTKWEKGTFGQYASMVVADRRILILSEDGKLNVIEASPEGYKPLASLTLSKDGNVWSHLAVVGSRLFVKDKTHLIRYDFAEK